MIVSYPIFQISMRARVRGWPLVIMSTVLSLGCHRDMYDQPRYEPLEPSSFFSDGRSARPIPDGAVAYQAPPKDTPLQTGIANGQLVEQLPIELNAALLQRGRQRFEIYCSVCHGRTGEGNGMIVERGYQRPPSYHSQRLRGLPVGHFFDVATRGFGAMPSYAWQVPVADRWAIAAYIRALQFSQYAHQGDLPADLTTKLGPANQP
jgi:mono/diheme cytochrome c family protein